MSAQKSPLVDPRELFPAAVGIGLGCLILVFFVLLGKALDMPVLVNHHDIPMQ